MDENNQKLLKLRQKIDIIDNLISDLQKALFSIAKVLTEPPIFFANIHDIMFVSSSSVTAQKTSMFEIFSFFNKVSSIAEP